MSLNRFLLAALSASLPHTIEASEYMVANSVVPLSVRRVRSSGSGLATPAPDLGPGDARLPGQCDLVCHRRGRVCPQRRPGAADPPTAAWPRRCGTTRARDVVVGLVEALVHLRDRRAAGIGLLTIAAHRLIYGIVTVATILVFRNYFHSLDEVDAAIADLGLLVVITGAGFVFASVVTPPMSARLGLRSTMIICFLASAVFQLVPGAIYARVPLMVAAFLLGLTAQCIKICVDTLVQAHVADEFKGRVFVIYDMIFNVALVVAAVIAAVILPANGKSVIILSHGRRLPAGCSGLCADQPWRQHERGHRVPSGSFLIDRPNFSESPPSGSSMSDFTLRSLWGPSARGRF